MTYTQISTKIECMEYIPRMQEQQVFRALDRNRSVLLLGARQTGKTTLAGRLEKDWAVSFIRPDIRQRYEKNPSLLSGEVEALKPSGNRARPLVLLDEVQKVPQILDVVQDLIDREKANFLLTGSSARKLRRGDAVNLLPGRIAALRLDPFLLRENPGRDLSSLLLYGSLPAIVGTASDRDKETDLGSYVTVYLEEEVRAEAIVRNLGSFARFLEIAASESGQIVNLLKLSQEVGVSHTTIASYYQILEDCLIAERVEPLTKSKTRKKLTRAQKYLFFDLGVRRLAAKEGTRLSRETMALLFEQFVGLELLRTSRLADRKVQVRFWRDPDGAEIDWVVEGEGSYTPVEVKWTSAPSINDARHLRTFLSEYQTKEGFLVCQTPRRVKLADRVFAVPWQETDELILK